MKKVLLILVAVISFLGINEVKADTLSSSNYFVNFDSQINYYLNNSETINTILTDYYSQVSSQYPYYLYAYNTCYSELQFYAYEEIPSFSYIHNSGSAYSFFSLFADYYIKSDTLSPQSGGRFDIMYVDDPNNNHSCYQGYLYSNFDLIYDKSSSNYDTIQFSTYTSNSYDITISGMEIEEGDIFPSYLSIYDGSHYHDSLSNYTEVNLNEYSYIALSLKDYTLRNNDTNQFYTDIYTKGQLCLTPIYNYGMTEKKEYSQGGYQTQACSIYYDNYTPVRTYILKQDLENHAIYYLKAYDTTKENKVKVDSSIFDITYFTSQNENSPSVIINGRSYPTIPYSDLTDSSTISESEGYTSGQVCSIGDINCYNENSGSSFTDIFSHPLESLKSSWTAILSILALISAFIALLPPTLQVFLYASFTLAVGLGLIKIIL